jgi:PAS domain S-box-containing protein
VKVTYNERYTDNPDVLQRLRRAEIALREQGDDLSPELQRLPALLRDIRHELDGKRPSQQKLETQRGAAQPEREELVSQQTAALQTSEARFQAIFEEAPVGIALLDEEGRIIQSNAKLHAMIGLDGAALKKTCFYDHIHCEDIDELSGQHVDVLQEDAQICKLECRLVRPDEETVWVQITGARVDEPLDHSPMTLVMIDDITEERAAQLALVQTEKLALTGRLATSLAHEINNPLQTAIGCLGLAEEAKERDANIDLYLQMASQELKRAANIIIRLRDLNRRSKEGDREPTDVREVIRQVIAITRKRCEERGVSVQTDLGVNVPDIQAVPDRLQQVFLNLILNAIDAMPNGGTLSVRILPLMPSDGVKIIIKDTGIGIPPKDQPHIFEAFQTTKSDGLGLGLFISQSIIEDHGGTIDVNSQPKVGSRFVIRLPAE